MRMSMLVGLTAVMLATSAAALRPLVMRVPATGRYVVAVVLLALTGTSASSIGSLRTVL